MIHSRQKVCLQVEVVTGSSRAARHIEQVFRVSAGSGARNDRGNTDEVWVDGSDVLVYDFPDRHGKLLWTAMG